MRKLRDKNDQSQKDRRSTSWAVNLFGLVFLAVGAGFLILSVIPNLWDAMRMQNWVQVPAVVEATDLESSHSSDSTTYKVSTRFSYEYNGQRYVGQRVGIADGGGDNVGSWQEDTHQRLQGQRQTRLWVNPAEPSESVFDRELRGGLLGFKMIFVIVFGGAGAVVLWYFNRKPRPVPSGLPAWQAAVFPVPAVSMALNCVCARRWNCLIRQLQQMIPGLE